MIRLGNFRGCGPRLESTLIRHQQILDQAASSVAGSRLLPSGVRVVLESVLPVGAIVLSLVQLDHFVLIDLLLEL